MKYKGIRLSYEQMKYKGNKIKLCNKMKYKGNKIT